MRNTIILLAAALSLPKYSSGSFIFLYDKAVLPAIRCMKFKITFSAKLGENWWDNPLQNFGRPLITNL